MSSKQHTSVRWASLTWLRLEKMRLRATRILLLRTGLVARAKATHVDNSNKIDLLCSHFRLESFISKDGTCGKC